MSLNSIIKNNNTVTKKCGEIIITMKKNAKNVYSFNCWFCDTICIQMKKFTLHLEKEHVAQLEQTTSIISEHNEDNFNNKMYTTKESADEILVGELKIEDCDFIKSGTENQRSEVKNLNAKDKLLPTFHDPLETCEGNLGEIPLPVLLNNDQLIVLEEDKSIQIENENVEMPNLKDDVYNEDHSDFPGEDNITDSDIEYNADEKPSKPFKRNTKAKEKELILALIEAYYKYPQLWNTSLAERCNQTQKEDIFQSITDDINAKLKIELKLYSVKKKLKYICKQYEREIEKQMNENESIAHNSKIWFYENMSFLKSIIECKLKLKRKKSNRKLKPLNDSILCDLIDIYRNYNSLWDVNHLAYTVKDKRQETMQSMLDDIKTKMNLTLDIYKLEKHLNYIHKSFSEDKQLRLECQANQQDFKPSCSYFNKCDFLEMHQGPFRCPNCSEIVDTYNDFQIHKSQHDGSIPFQCHECGMGFKKIHNYTIHAKRHLRVFKFHCEICGKGYPVKSEIDLHMRSHTGALPFLCSLCGERFRTAIGYDNHIRRHEERFRYNCHICKKGFNHLSFLKIHVKAHLNVRDIICTICGKAFTCRKYLLYHMRIHGGKNYTCNICGKSYAQSAGLRQHKRTHAASTSVKRIPKD